MSFDLNKAAQIYIAKLWGKPVGFCAVLHFPHPSSDKIKKISRIVVLPDYQGIGIGKVLINYVGEYYSSLGFKLTITTSHPSINKSLKFPWVLRRQGRVSSGLNATAMKGFAVTNTRSRITCSWEYINSIKSHQ